MNGQLGPLIRERDELASAHVARCAAGQRRGETESAAQARKRAARIARLVNLGQFSKARCHLLSPGMAEVSPQVLQQLREKHPPRVVPIDWRHIDANPSEPIHVTWDVLEEVLRKAPKLSSPGPSGLRTDHIQSLLFANLSTADKAAMSEMFTDFTNARVPRNSLSALLAASLVPIRKSFESDDVRPVALGETLMKIPARCIAKTFRKRINEKLMSGFQFGEGVPGGLESVVHSIRVLLDQNPEFLALSIDMKNAFNTIRRADVAKQLHAQFPELIPFFKMCYDPKSRLYVRTGHETLETLVSEEGTRQGDPLAGTYFNLGFLHVLQNVIQRFPTLTPFGIHDDVTLVGPPAEVFEALEWLVRAVPETTGGEIQATKTIAHRPAGKPADDTLYPGIRWLPTGGEDIQPETFTYVKYKQGLVVAGVPIGSDEFIKHFLDSVSADTLKLSQAIDTLKSSDFERQAFLLDFYCLRPRVNHIFRGLPPRYLPDFASDHDTLMRDAISKTLGVDSMEPHVVKQVFSPQSGSAGLSFTESSKIAPIAYIASLALSASVMARVPSVNHILQSFVSSAAPYVGWLNDFHDARLQIESSCEEEVPSLADFTLEPIHAYQRKLTSSVKTVLVEEYLSNLSPYDWARITSAGSPGASNWLTAVPGESSQNLTSEQFRVALSWRLGLPQPILRGVHRCSLGDRHPPVDPQGVHFVNMNCGSANTARFGLESLSGEWRTVRHDAIAYGVSEFVREAGFRTKWQPSALPGLPPERKGDVEIFDFPRPGKSLILDVTCVGPYTCTFGLNHTPDGATAKAARVAEEKKEASYFSLEREFYNFLPLAFDVFGGAAPKAEDFFKRLASMAVTKRTGLSEGPHFSAKYTVLLNKWRTRLSTVLNREVANCIIEGARNARGGERLDSNSVVAGSLHLFESIQPRL